MNDANQKPLDLQRTQQAYFIIENLLNHIEAVHDLVALMARALEEETARALTNTPHWENYLASKRNLENTKSDIADFVAAAQKLSETE
jgi:hypothetical protein